MKISFGILYNGELNYISNLLAHIRKCVSYGYEIIIIEDCCRDKKSLDLFRELEQSPDVKIFTRPLSGNFSEQKNFMNSKCSFSHIMNIDSDELPHEYLIRNLLILIDNNPCAEVFSFPRINVVDGITSEYIKKWGWNINSKGWINFPDRQNRLYLNMDRIRWTNKVHEVLIGYRTIVRLPEEEIFCLYHKKTIQRQIKQNQKYTNMI